MLLYLQLAYIAPAACIRWLCSLLVIALQAIPSLVHSVIVDTLDARPLHVAL